MKKMIFIVICLALSGCAGKRLPLVKVSGYTSKNASATSNVFLLNKVTSEFSVGNIVTIGDSKKEHEIIKVTALNKSESGNSQSIILMDGVGFVVKKGWKVSVVGGGSLLDPPPPPPSDTSSPVVEVSGYTSHSAPATSNVFVLKEVTSNIYVDCIYRPDWKQGSCAGITSEFSKGDIVTFGHSKEEYEIREAKVLKKSESGNIQDGYIYMEKEWAIRVLYKGTEFKITQRPFDIIMSGSGNIQGIVLKKAVGFIISPGMRVRNYKP